MGIYVNGIGGSEISPVSLTNLRQTKHIILSDMVDAPHRTVVVR